MTSPNPRAAGGVNLLAATGGSASISGGAK